MFIDIKPTQILITIRMFISSGILVHLSRPEWDGISSHLLGGASVHSPRPGPAEGRVEGSAVLLRSHFGGERPERHARWTEM